MAGSGNAPAILALTLLHSPHETWDYLHGTRRTHHRVHRRLNLLCWFVQPAHVGGGGRWPDLGGGRSFPPLGTQQTVAVGKMGGGRHWGSTLGGRPLAVGKTGWETFVGNPLGNTYTKGSARMGSRICSKPNCPVIHDGTGGSRCPEHTRAAKEDHWARTRAYSSREHRAFRQAVLHKHPVCVICSMAVSTVADHHPHSREDLTALGMNPNDPDKGRGLCKPCHDTETARNQPGGWNAGN